jgi:hypothetical protein
VNPHPCQARGDEMFGLEVLASTPTEL